MATEILSIRRREERVLCDLDQWQFDPRYTNGACPICGWVAPGWPREKPAWRRRFDAVQWDFVGLIALFALLIVLAFLVAQAARIIK